MVSQTLFKGIAVIGIVGATAMGLHGRKEKSGSTIGLAKTFVRFFFPVRWFYQYLVVFNFI